MDSTQAIIRFWRLCLPSTAGPQSGGDGANTVEVLRVVLERELARHLNDLGGSVDDILWYHMQPDGGGVVGFLQFWRGMEQILEACGARRRRLPTAKQHAVDGFQFLRNCILDMEQDEGGNVKDFARSVFTVGELRYFIDRTVNIAGNAGPDGRAYWQAKADELPQDDGLCVTGEEVASALLAWLEELVIDRDDYDDSLDEGSGSTSVLGRHHQHQHWSPRAEPAHTRQAAVRPLAAGLCPRSPHDCEEPATSPLSLGHPPNTPRGPPPQRSVLSAVRSSEGSQPTLPGRTLHEQGAASRYVGAAGRISTKSRGSSGQLQRHPPPFEAGLTQPLQRAPTSKSRNVSENAGICCTKQLGQAIRVLFTVLQALFRRRKVGGFAAFLALKRAGNVDQGSILLELLKSQCEIAMELEARVERIGRAGGLAHCLARLQRANLRSSWVVWCHLAGSGTLRSSAPPAGQPPTPQRVPNNVVERRSPQVKLGMPRGLDEAAQLDHLLRALQS